MSSATNLRERIRALKLRRTELLYRVRELEAVLGETKRAADDASYYLAQQSKRLVAAEAKVAELETERDKAASSVEGITLVACPTCGEYLMKPGALICEKCWAAGRKPVQEAKPPCPVCGGVKDLEIGILFGPCDACKGSGVAG